MILWSTITVYGRTRSRRTERMTSMLDMKIESRKVKMKTVKIPKILS